MKKSNIFILPLLLIIFFYLFACKKERMEKRHREALIGKYSCNVQIYNASLLTHCYDDTKVSEKSIIEEVYVVDDYRLAIKPAISLSYNINNLPYDTVKFVKNFALGTNDSIRVYEGNSDKRHCFLAINNDSIYLSVEEYCKYSYYIKGNK